MSSSTQLPPTYGVSNLYLFPVFQTREAYRLAVGVEPPPYNERIPIKSWFDPDAHKITRRKIIYENVIACNPDNGAPLADDAGKPMLEPLVIDVAFAGAVNIPFKAPGVPDKPTTGFETPVPLRPLTDNEELFFQFGGTVAVKNKAAFAQLEQLGKFTDQDRALLQAIAAKLGI